jgi:ubiquitin-protein ligase
MLAAALSLFGSALVYFYIFVCAVTLFYTYQTIVMEPIINRMLLSCLMPEQPANCAISDFTNTTKQSPLRPPTQEEREQAMLDYKLTIEYKHLKSHSPGGVYLIPSMDNLRFFYGVVFVRRGPYTNGIFKFTLALPLKYNGLNMHPEIRFLSQIYNPFVDAETGLLDLKSSFPRWDPSRHYLVTVVTFLKKIFYAKTFEDAHANVEAKQLALSDPDAFRAKVDQCVRESQKFVYDNVEGTTATFSEEALTHRVLRDLLKANIKDPSQITKTTILAMIDKASKV